MPNFRLWLVIRRIKREVKRLARLYYADVEVSSYGVTHIDPRHLVILILTKTDAERDRLGRELLPYERLRAVLVQFSYPADAIPGVRFVFESRESVGYGEDLYNALK
jgi:hypothetical protein